MAYGDELMRVSVIWEATGVPQWGQELAVTTFHLEHKHFTSNTFDWDSATAQAATDIQTRYGTHWSALSPYISDKAEITAIKCAHIDAQGRTQNEGIVAVPGGTLKGTSTANMMPPETAFLVSFWGYLPGSFAPVKARKRARFYVPYVSSTLLDPTGLVEGANRVAFLAGWQALFNDIQGMHTGTLVPPETVDDYFALVAASKIDASKTQIGWISSENHWASQRRRQHQAPVVRDVDTISHA